LRKNGKWNEKKQAAGIMGAKNLSDPRMQSTG